MCRLTDTPFNTLANILRVKFLVLRAGSLINVLTIWCYMVIHARTPVLRFNFLVMNEQVGGSALAWYSSTRVPCLSMVVLEVPFNFHKSLRVSLTRLLGAVYRPARSYRGSPVLLKGENCCAKIPLAVTSAVAGGAVGASVCASVGGALCA